MSKTQFDDNLRRIARELRRLEATSSPISRRNARKRVLTSMRVLRGAIDEAFPAIIDRTGVKRLKTIHGRIARLESAGWSVVEWRGVSISDSDAMEIAGAYASAGVPVKRINGRDRTGHHESWAVLVPRWATAIGHANSARLREAKKSVKIRNAAIVAAAL